MSGSIAIIGNPNTGKSTIFNLLTGLRQRTGNYPGVTVERKSGTLQLDGEAVELVDLPGCYSLDANSLDECVVIDALSGLMPELEPPQAVIVVVDAANIRRNLFLASQVAETGIPMVIALNQWDVAQRRDIRIDFEAMEQRLGVPVVAMSASKGLGIAELKAAVGNAIASKRKMTQTEWPEAVQEAVDCIDGAELSGFVKRRLLFDNSSILQGRIQSHGKDISADIPKARDAIRRAGLNPSNAEAILRYKAIDTLIDGIVVTNASRPASSETIDRLLCHRVWGMAFFIAMMWFVFQSVYAWAGPFMDWIDGLFGWMGDLAGTGMAGAPMLQSLVVDGVIAGVGGVVIFLPQIFILFFFIGLLEDTGYMARAAFLMDKAFGWCGLNGKCFIPLLSSYACAIPGIMATRTIEDPKARLATAFVAPLMSCSARLPVYIVFIGAFIEPTYGPAAAGIALFLMHFVGLAVAAPMAYVLNRYVLKTPPQPFLLEMPSYKVPKIRDLLLRVWLQGREFLVNAGTVIFAFSIIIWALLYFPQSEATETAYETTFINEQAEATVLSPEQVRALLDANDEAMTEAYEAGLAGAHLENSYLARFGKTIQPVFAPAGFDWKLTVGLLASFPARELIVSTLGIIYNLGDEVDESSTSLRERLTASTWQEGPRAGQPVVTLPVAIGIMLFFALCMQCGATVAVMGKEIGWRYAWGAFALYTFLGWLAAVVVYQIGTALA